MQHDPQMTAPIELTDSMGAREELLIVRQAASGILQWFGLVEPAQITPAGRLAAETGQADLPSETNSRHASGNSSTSPT